MRDEILEEVFATYSLLTEKEKCRICREICRKSHDVFLQWKKLAGLDSGGFSEKSITSRSTIHIRKKLDQVLDREPDFFEKLLNEIYGEGFFGYREEFNNELRVSIEWPSAEKVIERLSKQHSGSKLFDLFKMVKIYQDFHFPEDIPLWRAKGKLEKLKEVYSKSFKFKESLIDSLSLMQTSGDLSDFEENLSEFYNLFHSSLIFLEVMHRRLDVEMPSLSSTEEIIEQINVLIDELQKKSDEEDADDFIDGLLNYITLLESTHRSPRKRDEINSLIASAASELENTKVKFSKPESWPEDPVDWLGWVTNLDSESFQEVCELCSSVSSSLIALIESAEPEQLQVREDYDQAEAVADQPEVPGNDSETPTDNTVENEQESDWQSDIEPQLAESDAEETYAPEPGEALKESLTEGELVVTSPEKPTDVSSEAIPGFIQDIQESEAIAWKSLESLEFHTALAVAELSEGDSDAAGIVFTPPSWLCELLILNECYFSHSRAVSLGLQGYYSRYVHVHESFRNQSDKQAFSILICILAARMALLSLAYEPRQILQSPDIGSLENYFHLLKAIHDFSKNGNMLNPTLVGQTLNESEYKTSLSGYAKQAKELLNALRKRQIISQPAQHVWNVWLGKESDSYVSKILQPVIEQNEKKTDDVAQSLGILLDSGIAECADKTYARLHRGNLISKARKQIVRHTSEAISIAQSWLGMVENHRSVNERTYQDLKKLIESFDQHYQESLSEVIQLRAESPSPLVSAVSVITERNLKQIRELLSGSDWGEVEVASKETLLYSPMLRLGFTDVDCVQELKLNKTVYRNALLAAETRPVPIMNTLKVYCDNGRHDLAETLLDALHYFSVYCEIEEIEALSKLIETSRGEWIDRIVSACLSLEKELGKAFLSGYLENEREHSEIQALYETYLEPSAFDELTRYDMILQQLEGTIDYLQKRKTERIDSLLQELSLIKDKSSDSEFDRLRKLAESADSYTFNNYCHMISIGQKLPEEESPEGFLDEFFTSDRDTETTASLLESFISNKGIRHAIKAVEKRESLAGIDLKRVSGKQAKEKYGRLLKLWFDVKEAKRVTAGKIQDIFSLLDFPVLNSTAVSAKVFKLETRPITDRNICAIPQFGSQAQGHYKVICEWEFPTQDLLLTKVSDNLVDNRTLVLFFGRLTEKRRRELAREARARQKSLLVLDDILLFYLCTQRQSPLPAFFDCAIPFSWAQTYNITSSYVPSEMFYGRRKELDSILNPSGSCVVYGGRQLGKTALLRKARDEFNSPEKGLISIYLDLKSELVGLPPKDIWRLLVKTLKQHEVLPSKVNERTGPDKLREHILGWLEVNSERRILLLLDEADKLLEWDSEQSDEREFEIVQKLKVIMEKSNRRFKVVLSGLHNVQRMIRNPNSPLAHLGEPLCIGPLFKQDIKEARELIRRPFMAMGFQFDSEDLITKILAQTNYYPSLIQIYCLHLHRYLNESLNEFSASRTPPYRILKRHVDGAYRSKNIREDIRNRFMWTLDLDLRFRILTDVIALWGNELSGISFSEILHHCKDLSVFDPKITDRDTMRALLDEMQGLGIIIKKANDTYNFRSPNVKRLLGDEEEVESDLLHSVEKYISLPEESHHQGEMRRNLADETSSYSLSCLTTSQEAMLRSYESECIVCCGCKATFPDHLPDSLAKVFGADSLTVLDSSSDRSTLKELLSDKGKEGHHCIFVPEDTAWTMEWIETANEFISRKWSKKSIQKIVFFAGPRALWDLRDRFLNGPDMKLMHLSPWTPNVVHTWMKDNVEWRSFMAYPDSLGEVCRITGSWPTYLYGLIERIRHSDEEGLKEALSEDLILDPAAIETFNLGDRARRKVLQTAALLGNCNPLKLVESPELQDYDPVMVRDVVQWAESLGYLSACCLGDGEEKVINPLIEDILMKDENLIE